MTKKFISVTLALVMIFACAMPAFAASVANTVEAAALKAARAEYLAIDDTHTDTDKDYTGFEVTRTQVAVDEDGRTYYTVTLRSNFAWKATVEVRAYDIVIDEGFITSNEQLVSTNILEGIFGYIIDVIMSFVDNFAG